MNPVFPARGRASNEGVDGGFAISPALRLAPSEFNYALARRHGRRPYADDGATANRGCAHMKKEAAVSYRTGLTIAATLAVGLAGALPNTAGARDYKIGCAGGGCVIVDDTGRISFFAIGDKKLSASEDQLKPCALGRIRPPMNVSCGAQSGGDACVITDADGDVWVGSAHSGVAFGAPVTRIPPPAPR